MVETTGFPLDRHWMIVTEAEGRFVTQRQEAKLALITTHISDSIWLSGSNGPFEPDAALTLTAPNMVDFQARLSTKETPGRCILIHTPCTLVAGPSAGHGRTSLAECSLP